MYCSSCGSIIPEGAAFCEKCGARAESGEDGKPFSANKSKNNEAEPLHGLLKFLVYAAYVSCAVLAVYGIVLIIQMFTLISFLGKHGASTGKNVFLVLLLALFFAAVIYMVWKLASKIKDRDLGFLKFYHVCAVITLAINLILQWVQSGFGTALLDTVIYAGAYFGFTMYFCKSKQIRKYMGSDEFIRLSPLTAPFADRLADKPEEAPKVQVRPVPDNAGKTNWTKMESAGKSTADEIVCRKCGAVMPADSLFCEECGTKVISVPEAAIKPAASGFAEPMKKPEPAPMPEPAVKPMPVPAPMPVPVQKPEPVPVRPAVPQAAAERPVQNDTASTAEEQRIEKSEFLKGLPIDGDGNTIRFYSDKVIFDGKEVRYCDVAVLQAEGSTSSTYGLVTGSHFSGHINFQTYDGIKNMLKISGTSVYGIGGTRGSEQRYQAILREVINIAARKIAVCHLEKIRRGSTIDLSGFTIDSRSVTGKRGLSRETVHVTKEDFGSCSIVGHGLVHGVFIYNKAGEKLLAVPQSNPNAYVLFYVVNGIFR